MMKRILFAIVLTAGALSVAGCMFKPIEKPEFNYQRVDEGVLLNKKDTDMNGLWIGSGIVLDLGTERYVSRKDYKVISEDGVTRAFYKSFSTGSRCVIYHGKLKKMITYAHPGIKKRGAFLCHDQSLPGPDDGYFFNMTFFKDPVTGKRVPEEIEMTIWDWDVKRMSVDDAKYVVGQMNSEKGFFENKAGALGTSYVLRKNTSYFPPFFYEVLNDRICGFDGPESYPGFNGYSWMRGDIAPIYRVEVSPVEGEDGDVEFMQRRNRYVFYFGNEEFGMALVIVVSNRLLGGEVDIRTAMYHDDCPDEKDPEFGLYPYDGSGIVDSSEEMNFFGNWSQDVFRLDYDQSTGEVSLDLHNGEDFPRGHNVKVAPTIAERL